MPVFRNFVQLKKNRNALETFQLLEDWNVYLYL